jgi:hypothetical protein
MPATWSASETKFPRRSSSQMPSRSSSSADLAHRDRDVRGRRRLPAPEHDPERPLGSPRPLRSRPHRRARARRALPRRAARLHRDPRGEGRRRRDHPHRLRRPGLGRSDPARRRGATRRRRARGTHQVRPRAVRPPARHTGRRVPVPHDDALQLDLPLRRRDDRQQPRLRRPGCARPGPSPAEARSGRPVFDLHEELRRRLGARRRRKPASPSLSQA